MDSNRDVTKTKRRDQCGRKRKTTSRDDKMILQNTFKDLRNTSKDLQRNLATVGVNVDSSTVRKRLFEAGRKARSSCKMQLLTVAMKKKRLNWGKNTKKEEKMNSEVFFSDESHFKVHGRKFHNVRRSIGEPLNNFHIL